MPFKSEKQRRFLWAAHPDIAKRWAHEYPDSNKGLPMYAKQEKQPTAKEKEAALAVLQHVITTVVNTIPIVSNSILGPETKAANSGMVYVNVPHGDKPTYAGQERAETGENKDETTDCDENGKNTGNAKLESIFGKLAAVLAKPLREMMEAQQAATEGRDPRFVPQNLQLKRLSFPSPMIPPPMGMAPQPQKQAPAQQAQQPGNAQQSSPVGGGANPQHNPINAFGPLGAKGQLNGNAAFGVKNSPDSLKTAALKVIYKRAASSGAWTRAEGKSESGGLNAKGRADS